MYRNMFKLSSFFNIASDVLRGRKNIFEHFRQLSEFFGKYFGNFKKSLGRSRKSRMMTKISPHLSQKKLAGVRLFGYGIGFHSSCNSDRLAFLADLNLSLAQVVDRFV